MSRNEPGHCQNKKPDPISTLLPDQERVKIGCYIPNSASGISSCRGGEETRHTCAESLQSAAVLEASYQGHGANRNRGESLMGLYLCILDEGEEIDGLEVGSYADYGALIKQVVERLESGVAGSRFPVLVLHSDCDGCWTVHECSKLENELCSIIEEFKQLPPVSFNSAWQEEVAKQVGHRPQNLYESFIDVDGELLIERLVELVRTAQRRNEPLVFQ